MRIGNRMLTVLGAAELLLGAGCVTLTLRNGRIRLPWALVTAAAVTAGTFHICGALAESREEIAL